MQTEKLNIVTSLGDFKAKFVIDILLILFGRHGIPTNGFTLYGEPVDLVDVSTVLRKANRETFLLVGHGFEIDLASVWRYQVDILSIKADVQGLFWDDWITSIKEVSKIFEAWLVNADYDFWQNASDPLEYTSQNRQCEHLPKISNGLPPPLEKTVIDTSHNPGRRIFRVGYIEAIGSLMWLSDQFWNLTGADKSKVLKQNWIECQESPKDLLRIQISNHPFFTDEEDSAIVQRKLRQLLFPNEGSI